MVIVQVFFYSDKYRMESNNLSSSQSSWWHYLADCKGSAKIISWDNQLPVLPLQDYDRSCERSIIIHTDKIVIPVSVPITGIDEASEDGISPSELVMRMKKIVDATNIFDPKIFVEDSGINVYSVSPLIIAQGMREFSSDTPLYHQVKRLFTNKRQRDIATSVQTKNPYKSTYNTRNSNS